MHQRIRCPHCKRVEEVQVQLNSPGHLSAYCAYCLLHWQLVDVATPGKIVEDKQRPRGELDPEREIIRCERRPVRAARLRIRVPVQRGRCCICRMPVIVAKQIVRQTPDAQLVCVICCDTTDLSKWLNENEGDPNGTGTV